MVDKKQIAKKVRGNIMRLLISQESNTPGMAKVQTKIINYIDEIPIEELLEEVSVNPPQS